MKKLLATIDGLLRGRFTEREKLQRGEISVPVRSLVVAGLALGVIYGIFMGLFGGFRETEGAWIQIVAAAVKLPLLFLLTLAVTLPSLYVFSALAGSRLGLIETLRLLLAAITLNLALLASFGPVTGFFTLSTQSYAFMVLLSVLFCTISGIAGLAFLRRALDAVFVPPRSPSPESTDASNSGTPEKILPTPLIADPAAVAAVASDAGAMQAAGAPTDFNLYRSTPRESEADRRQTAIDRARNIFRVWMVIFAIVGAQMAWILRPFIGDPNRPFTWFREKQSNFFAAVISAIRSLLN